MTRRDLPKMVTLGLLASDAKPQNAPPAARQTPARAQPTLADRLEFFDGDVIFGLRLLPAERNIIGPPFLAAGDVLRELDHYHIREALLFHSACKFSRDPNGNELLLKAIEKQRAARNPRLHAAWSIVPDPDGKLPSADSVVGSLRKHGLRVARMFPVNHQYKLDPASEILAALEERKTPLIIDFGITFPHNDRTDWGAVESILRRRPALDVVLAHPPSRQNHHIFAMMELTTKFHINPAGFRVHQEVSAMCRLFGPAAVIYGSHLPFYTAAAPLAETIYSDLTFQEQKIIAGDALRALLRGAKP